MVIDPSTLLAPKTGNLTEADISRIVEMAWEDRTTFDDIFIGYGVNESQVIDIMRANMKRSSFKMWRERVSGRSTKHAARSDGSVTRHKANHRWQGG